MFENFIGNVVSNVKIEKKIVKGSGKIFIGVDEKTKEKLIIKVIGVQDDSLSFKKSIEAETTIGLSLSKKCFFLVRIREIVTRPDFIFIIMEFCPEGDLTDLIDERVKQNKPFSDDNILEIMFQLGSAIETLHDAGVIHRDIKTDNVFIMRNEINDLLVKLGDYGISRIVNSNLKNTTLVMGTIGYTPPEILSGEGEYTTTGDIYGLGVILVQVVDLKHPFLNEKGLINQARVFTGQTNSPRSDLSAVQQSVRQFALQMMSINPAVRPSIANVLDFAPLAVFLRRYYCSAKKNMPRSLTTSHSSSFLPPQPLPPPPFSSDSSSSSYAGRKEHQISFRAVSKPDGIICSGAKVIFKPDDNGGSEVLIEQDLSSARIYSLEVSFKGSIFAGLSMKALRLKSKGTCMIFFNGIFVGASLVARNQSFWRMGGAGTLCLQLDQSTHTLHFFVDQKQVPFCVTSIPSNVYFTISSQGFENTWMEVRSLYSVPASTDVSSRARLPCTEFMWNVDKIQG